MFSDSINDELVFNDESDIDQIANSEGSDVFNTSENAALNDEIGATSELEETIKDNYFSESYETFDGASTEMNSENMSNSMAEENSYLDYNNILADHNLSEYSNFVEWYSGDSQEQRFEVNKNTASQIISGNNECRTIHLNIGLSSYGWHISFANGVIMSVADVREYQLRNGKLPDSSGVIVYAQKKIE